MTAHYVIHIPKATEVYSVGEDEGRALERGANFGAEEDYDVVAVFRVEDDIKTPIAFFYNGQKFIPQKPSE